MSAANLEIVLRRTPVGAPVADDFEARQAARPIKAPRDGLLVRVITLSLDPYLGSRLRGRHLGEAAPSPGESLPGFAVAEVLSSNATDFAKGDFIVAETGWRQYALVAAKDARKVSSDVPLSAHLGLLGMPGLTAWAGVTQLARVQRNDIFLVDAAAGPVGSTAGQIARILGARAVGVAGGEEKCALVREKFKFDACIDRTDPSWRIGLKTACAPGPTVHFENVGLSILNAVTPMLQNYARVVLCGLVEHYHSDERALFPLGDIVAKRAAFHGLVVYDFQSRQHEWTTLGGRWLRDGHLAMHEDIAPNLSAAPQHFEKLMNGQNIGKALVRVGPDEE